MGYVALTLTSYESKTLSTENYYFIYVITAYTDLSSGSSSLTLTAGNFSRFLIVILLMVTLATGFSANSI